MAYLANDDKLEGQGQPQALGGGAGAGSPMVGASSSDVGSGVSTAGVGKGGTGGWTNIQAYLNANKDNNSTANAINSQFGSAFEQEESKINQGADAVKSQADGAVNKIRDARGQADSYASRAAGYEPGTSERKGVVDEVQGLTNGAYAGPKTYSYGIGAEAQDYGSRVQDSKKALESVYSKAGNMSSGQRTLQNQLDVNNPAVEQARQAQAARYAALQNLATQKTAETNDYLNATGDRYKQEQGALTERLGDLRRQYSHDTKGGTYDPKKYAAVSEFLGMPSELEPQAPKLPPMFRDNKPYYGDSKPTDAEPNDFNWDEYWKQNTPTSM